MRASAAILFVLPVVGAAWQQQCAQWKNSPQQRRHGTPVCQQFISGEASSDEKPSPPIPLRCLSRQEVLDKLNAVPVFGVANAAEELIATPDPESGSPVSTFYLELSEAQAAMRSLQEANPRAAIQLTVAPLGTAFALSEWQEQPSEEPGENPLIPDEAAAAFADDEDGDAFAADYAASSSDEDAADAAFLADIEAQEASGTGADALSGGSGGSGGDGAKSTDVAVRLQASQEEVADLGELLTKSPAPPLLRRRNAREGSIPLFGSDLLKFQMPSAEQGGEGEGGEMMPLFLRRADFKSAWAASGGAPDKVPAIQLTDLRTLAYQMQFDTYQDYRPMLLVASDASIEFVQRQEAALAEADVPELSAEDLQSLLFGSQEA